MDVIVVEDSVAMSERLTEALNELPDVRVVGRADGAASALAAIRNARPQFVVLDLHLAQGNGLDVLQEIQRFEPRPLVAVLTNFPYPQYRTRCAQLGASYLFVKDAGIDALLQVCRHTARELAAHAGRATSVGAEAMSNAAVRSAASVAAPPARVLAGDDDASGRKALRRVLTAFGYRVDVAQDGPEALAMLSLDPELVIVDAQMPRMDGFEVARRIRSNPARQGVAILMITGMDTPEDRARAAEAGVSGFLAKPYEIVELRRCCATLQRGAAAVPDRAQTPQAAPVR